MACEQVDGWKEKWMNGWMDELRDVDNQADVQYVWTDRQTVFITDNSVLLVNSR